MEGDVEYCAWKGGEAGKERGHCDEGVDVPAGYGREAVDEDGDDDGVRDATDERAEEGGGVEEAKSGVGRRGWHVRTYCYPAC